MTNTKGLPMARRGEKLFSTLKSNTNLEFSKNLPLHLTSVTGHRPLVFLLGLGLTKLPQTVPGVREVEPMTAR